MSEANLKPGFWSRAAGWLVGAAKPVPGPAAEPAPFREAYGTTVDADEENWRPLTSDASRDLAPMTQSRMQRIAHYLWEQNLLANRLIELPVAYLLGEGVQLKADDEEAQAAIDAFWEDPINEMNLKLPKKVRELALFGEQCWPAFINEVNGHVRIGSLDPALIERVAVDPDNPEQPIGIETVKDARGNARKFRVIVNGPEDVFTSRTQAIRRGFSDGECFYFRVNDLSSGRRGRSDLLAQADWLDTYEQYMFGEADRALALRSFIWDVTLTGATPEEIKKRAGEISTPKPNSVRIHNDAEKWTAEAPKLSSGDTSEIAKLMRGQILGGATLPPHWYADPGDVNRSTGESMTEPTVKVLTQRQNYWKHVLVFLGKFVVLRAWEKAGKGEPDWKEINLRAEFPEIQARDTTKYAAALMQVTSAVTVQIDRGLITEETGLAVIALVANRLGMDIDPKDELEAAREEAADRALNDPGPGNPGIPDLPGTGPQPGDPQPGDQQPPDPNANAGGLREAIDAAVAGISGRMGQLADRIDLSEARMSSILALRETVRGAPESVAVNLPEIQAPKPVAVIKEVLERDARDLISKTKETFIYEESDR